MAWDDFDGIDPERVWGTGVLLPGGTGGSTRVMQLGGAVPPSDSTSVRTTEVFDEANPSAGWDPAPSMQIGRGHHNTVLLPDGSMVTVGGGVGSRGGSQWAADLEHRQVELWNPANGQWTLGNAQAESRAYHSTALLLPDGRVISAGDDVNGGTDRDTAEIYEPPYLFKGPRPTITAAPTNVKFGTTVNVDTPNTNVTRASLVAPGATTHANDMNQRYIPLTVTQRAGGVTLTAPASPEIATPGYYMLFLLTDQGVPSVARFVRLGFESDPPPPPLDPIASDNCIRNGAALKGRSLGPARLGRTRKAQRQRLAAVKRRTLGNLDRYCVAGPGSLTIGYPSKRALRGLGRPSRRRLLGHVVLVTTSSPRFSVKGIRPGARAIAARRRLKGERRVKASGTAGWYVARIPGGRVVVRTRGRRVQQIGIVHAKLGRTSKRLAAVLAPRKG